MRTSTTLSSKETSSSSFVSFDPPTTSAAQAAEQLFWAQSSTKEESAALLWDVFPASEVVSKHSLSSTTSAALLHPSIPSDGHCYIFEQPFNH